jgi:hypothetical protein
MADGTMHMFAVQASLMASANRLQTGWRNPFIFLFTLPATS